jgi:hypothetical protein
MAAIPEIKTESAAVNHGLRKSRAHVPGLLASATSNQNRCLDSLNRSAAFLTAENV